MISPINIYLQYLIICFGAFFDQNSKDLSLSDYKESTFDISVDELIKRKSEMIHEFICHQGKLKYPIIGVVQ